MLKKSFEKPNNQSVECNSEKFRSDIKKSKENLYLSYIIGTVNVERWHQLKSLFSCENNQSFAAKLLDIAQEYVTVKLTKLNGNCTSNYENSFTEELFIEDPFRQSESSKATPNGDRNLLQETMDIEKEIEKLSSCTNNKVNSVLEKIEKSPVKSKVEGVKLENETSESVSKNSNKSKKKKPTVQKTKEKQNKDFDARRAPELQVQKEQAKETVTEDENSIKIKMCPQCNTKHINNQCPINNPHFIIADALNIQTWEVEYKNIHSFNNSESLIIKSEKGEEEDNTKFSYARLSVPNILCFAHTCTNHGLGVFAKSKIQPFTQFGPLVGDNIKEVDIPEDSNMRDIWEMVLESGNFYVNTEDLENSNWLRYMRPAPTRDKCNVIVTCKEKKLYFTNICSLNIGEELVYWQDNSVALVKKKMEKTICGGCNMTFAHPLYYRTHCSVFHDVRFSLTIRKYHCKVCGEAVLGKENIMRHAAELHNGQGAYQCQFCKKFFLRLNYLEMHRTYGCSANPHRSRPLCDFCGRKFCQPQKLKVHIKRMHSDMSEVLKEFQCKNCSKILGSRAALQRHMKEVHQKQMDGACSCTRCGKHFQNKSNLKIHMLTHSGIKPFRCQNGECNAAFTTKQCLQFHYKKVHNYTEDNMPKIERSVDYTFQAYSGVEGKDATTPVTHQTQQEGVDEENDEEEDDDSDIDGASLDSKSMDDPPALQSPLDLPEEDSLPPTSQSRSPPPPTDSYPGTHLNSNIKIVSKGSKKWIADEPLPPLKQSDLFSIDRLSKDDLSSVSLHDNELYDRNKLPHVSEFNRVEPSNASLLVEAALDSVCSEPNIDIDVSTTPNCSDSIVTNLYTLTQSNNLGEVSYNDTVCMTDTNLISPSVNDHISVTDEINDELRHNQNIAIDYPTFSQENFTSVSNQRLNFVKNYINSLSPHNNAYDEKHNMSPVPSPPRYDFGHAVVNDPISSDESNGMAAQNLSLNNSKSDIQLDLSVYKSYQRPDPQAYVKRLKFESENALETDIDIVNSELSAQLPETDDQERNKYTEDLSTEIRNKFELDLDLRLKNYESMDSEALRQRSTVYDSGATDLGFRNKGYDLIDSIESRQLESDFRTDRNFEPLMLNSTSDLQLQGLDMSARSLHNYPNINRYHHLYPDVDRVDLRLNYSPPPPPYSHDLLRVMSLDLTPPGRHSVDLSLRSHPLHQIANTRLLAEHTLQSNHRLLDQTRLLSTELASTRLSDSRLITEPSPRILSDHTTNRILGNTDHLLNSEQSRLLADESRILGDTSRLLEQRGLIGDGRILPAVPSSDAVSPVPFSGYPVPQSPYHPTPIAPRPHVTSPTPTPYHHYSTYY